MGRTNWSLEPRDVQVAERRAEELVSRFYVLAPREWSRMPFEVRTGDDLRPNERRDGVYAQVLCYGVERRVNDRVVDARDLYRICLQDRTILQAARSARLERLSAVLLYVLTHELVHVVRFGQRMQRLDLAAELRPLEEATVDRTARRILREVAEPGIGETLERFSAIPSVA